MQSKLWLAACTAVMIGLSGCGDKSKTEADPHGGPGGGPMGGPGGMGGPAGGGGTGGAVGTGGRHFAAVIIVHPARALQSPLAADLKDMPDVKMAEQELGISLSEIERIKLLIGPDLEGGIHGAPVVAAGVLSFTKDLKDAIHTKIVGELKTKDVTPQEKTHNGVTYSMFVPPQGDGPPSVAWYFPDGETMVISTEPGLQDYVDQSGATAADNVLLSGGMDADLIIAARKPENYEAVIRKAIEFAKQQGAPADQAAQIEQSIPKLKEFLDPLDTVYLSLDISGNQGASLLKVDVGVKTSDDAAKLFEVMNGGVGMAKLGYGMVKDQLKASLEPDKADAQLKPADDLVQSLSVKQDGTHVVAEAKTPAGFVEFVKEVAPRLMGGLLQNFGPGVGDPGGAGAFPGAGAGVPQ